MPLHTLIPSDSRLKELVASAALEERVREPVNGNAVLYRYTLPAELEEEIRREVFLKSPAIAAIIKGATVRMPTKKGVLFSLERGEIATDPDGIAILLPCKSPDALRKANLEAWRVGGDREKTQLEPGLFVIYPDVRYTMPADVPFIAYLTSVDRLHDTLLNKGEEQ
ncbi:hypothetical protein AG0111_0g12088 [Alternaria gaisen]|uniref:Uncharacterized protein n=1 Tax=Alternaria gaisen TaxID=167740 RepID=A0ACB6F5K6_9PLEO|nr:hypothetical protein AG0111_0g12088 [Alternaria gaisen]